MMTDDKMENGAPEDEFTADAETPATISSRENIIDALRAISTAAATIAPAVRVATAGAIAAPASVPKIDARAPVWRLGAYNDAGHLPPR